MSRYERRDSGSRRDSRDRRRSPGPSSSRRSPSPKPKPRDDKELPEAFGRIAEDVPNDESNVLQRMRKYENTPLGAVVKCLKGDRKIKIWTRNFKEVRGICTGYVVAFDKHWNIMMTDVDEVYLKPKRAKTPFLHDVKTAEKFKELPKKEPRKKNKEAAEADTEKDKQETEQENNPPATKEADKPTEPVETEKSSNPEVEKKKKKRKKSKNSATTTRRHVKQMFVRGDNIVMCAVLGEDD